jgi:hypothetical protein
MPPARTDLINLNCCIITNSGSTLLQVDINPAKPVASIKAAIKDDLSAAFHVTSSMFSIWVAQSPIEITSITGNPSDIPNCLELDPQRIIRDVFPTPLPEGPNCHCIAYFPPSESIDDNLTLFLNPAFQMSALLRETTSLAELCLLVEIPTKSPWVTATELQPPICTRRSGGLISHRCSVE